MRAFLITLGACSGAAPVPEPQVLPVAPVPARTVVSREPIDVIAALSQPAHEASWIVTGPAQLVLGGTSLQPLDEEHVLEVDLLEERGSDVRVGVRLDAVRFAIWTARSYLQSVLAREHRINGGAGPEAGRVPGVEPIEVTLRAGARVKRLARAEGWTRIRYVGSLEVEGWVPDEALSLRGTAGRPVMRRLSSGRKPMLVIPGTMIRSEPTRSARVLALTAYSSVLDIIKPVDHGWYEVGFDDGDVHVHGFASKREPPGAVHRKREPEAVARAPSPDRVASGTCLYANNERIGVVVGEARGTLVPSRPGWFTFTVDTPWDPIELEVRGPVETNLESCASSTP